MFKVGNVVKITAPGFGCSGHSGVVVSDPTPFDEYIRVDCGCGKSNQGWSEQSLSLTGSSKPEPASPRDTLTYKERKEMPICEGLLDYFPDACLYVAHVSFVANEQHNPGETMHWAKEKSIGKGNEIARHLLDRGNLDTDGLRHSGKLAWRAMELLQREIEAERAAGK